MTWGEIAVEDEHLGVGDEVAVGHEESDRHLVGGPHVRDADDQFAAVVDDGATDAGLLSSADQVVDAHPGRLGALDELDPGRVAPTAAINSTGLPSLASVSAMLWPTPPGAQIAWPGLLVPVTAGVRVCT